MDKELFNRLKKATEKHKKIPPKERFDQMVKRGAIDKDGNVLIRGPEPLKIKNMNNEKVCGHEDKGYYSYEYPRPAVTVDLIVVANALDKAEDVSILFVKRGGKVEHGKLALPGGFLNMDETGEQAALREFKEETGGQLPPDSTVEFYKVADGIDRDPRGGVISLVYVAIYEGRPFAVKGSDDAAEALWLPANDITNDQVANMAFDHGDIIERFLEDYAWMITKCPSCNHRYCIRCKVGS